MFRKLCTILFHFLVILNYVLFLLYQESIKDELYILFPKRRLFGGEWKYLTYWNIVLQLIYFIIAFINDIWGTESSAKDASSRLQKCRDFLFAAVAFPIGIFVPVMFWTLFNIDRNLIFPPLMDKFFPPITNHMKHTTPLPSQILELLLIYHIYPKRLSGILTNVLFCLTYIGWTFYIAYAGGIWVYPVLDHLNGWQRGLFIIACAVFGTLLYLIGEGCNKLIWKTSRANISRKVEKDKKT